MAHSQTVERIIIQLHRPVISVENELAMCVCGWKPERVLDDPWIEWVDHLPGMASDDLELTSKDVCFLSDMGIDKSVN